MTKSVFISAFILFCTALVETAILSNITILPAVPDLLLLCSVYLSLLNGRGTGEADGFISGLFMDFLTGVPFGFNCLFRTIIGYSAGWFGKSIQYRGIIMPAVIGFSVTLLKVFLIWLISLFFPLVVNTYNLFSVQFVFELLANTLCAPFIFKLMDSFRRFVAVHPEDQV